MILVSSAIMTFFISFTNPCPPHILNLLCWFYCPSASSYGVTRGISNHIKTITFPIYRRSIYGMLVLLQPAHSKAFLISRAVLNRKTRILSLLLTPNQALLGSRPSQLPSLREHRTILLLLHTMNIHCCVIILTALYRSWSLMCSSKAQVLT